MQQAVRSRCEGCSACDGFEIWFCAADANDPNVMLFCSRCGCATDKHSIDQASPSLSLDTPSSLDEDSFLFLA